MDKFKVLYLTNIPSPYMVGYLNEFGKYVDLLVVFEKAYDSTRPESWQHLLDSTRFENVILSGKSVSKKLYGDDMGSAPDDKALSFGVVKYLRREYDEIIVANPCTPTGIIAITYMRMHGISYSIQSEGGIPGSEKGFKERLKFFLMNKADHYFSTCDLDDQYFITYGAKKEEIYRYPFASISEKDLPEKILSQEEKEKFKSELGITYKQMVLTVGRSVYVKGFDVLLKSVKGLSDDTCVFFVGGKCTDEYREIISDNGLKNVYFVDNVEAQELRKYYCAADLFVLPTRSDTWGLVINEAMTFGLPVITTDKCVAGNALIEDGKNGFIVESDNVKQLREKLETLSMDSSLRGNFGMMNFELMRNWTFEEMGKVMMDNITSLIKITKTGR